MDYISKVNLNKFIYRKKWDLINKKMNWEKTMKK